MQLNPWICYEILLILLLWWYCQRNSFYSKISACKSLRYKIEMLLLETYWHNNVAFLQLSLGYKIKFSLSASWHFKSGIIFGCQFCWLIWLCLICCGVVIQLPCPIWLLARIVGLSRGISDTFEELYVHIFFSTSDCWYDLGPHIKKSWILENIWNFPHLSYRTYYGRHLDGCVFCLPMVDRYTLVSANCVSF